MTATTTPAVDPEKDLTLNGSALIEAIVERHGRSYLDVDGSLVTVVGGHTDDPRWTAAYHALDYLPSVRRLRAFLEGIEKGESVAAAARLAGISEIQEETILELGDDPFFDAWQLFEYAQRPDTPKDGDPIKTMGMLLDAVVEWNRQRAGEAA